MIQGMIAFRCFSDNAACKNFRKQIFFQKFGELASTQSHSKI